MAERPLVKNGEAIMSIALKVYRSQVWRWVNAAINPRAMKPRTRSLAIMIRRRSNRSSQTPASGPIRTAGIARDSMTPATTPPLWVISIARLRTAMLLK